MPRLWAQRIQSSANMPELREENYRRAGNGSVQLDISHRARNRGRYHPDVGALNVAIIGFSIVGYASLKLVAVYSVLHPLWRNHGTDILAMPVLLAFANLLTLRSPFPNAFMRPTFAMALTLTAAVFWELVAPTYAHSTSDLRDVVAYVAGACLYLLGSSRMLVGSCRETACACGRSNRRGAIPL
ncbi:MAG TPA: hypothetical protein VE974_14260 [Thermoanaerobaculia bacterium]|nr:hypothetical protein [Thermoanaerobaculia bacterium]